MRGEFRPLPGRRRAPAVTVMFGSIATDDMHAWAAYLCGQAGALGFVVIDTSGLDIEQATDALVPRRSICRSR